VRGGGAERSWLSLRNLRVLRASVGGAGRSWLSLRNLRVLRASVVNNRPQKRSMRGAAQRDPALLHANLCVSAPRRWIWSARWI